jgi:hypothetical protein
VLLCIVHIEIRRDQVQRSSPSAFKCKEQGSDKTKSLGLHVLQVHSSRPTTMDSSFHGVVVLIWMFKSICNQVPTPNQFQSNFKSNSNPNPNQISNPLSNCNPIPIQTNYLIPIQIKISISKPIEIDYEIQSNSNVI